MCLILISKNNHSQYKLIIAANRDEYYNRPSKQVDWWNEHTILSGVDIKAKGTWLGINRSGHIAAITNYRNPSLNDETKVSRGELSHHFLTHSPGSDTFLSKLQSTQNKYNPYNIIYGNVDTLSHYSNISQENVVISNGTHGLSNHLLNTSWPKVKKGILQLEQTLSNDTFAKADLLNLLADAKRAEPHTLPKTGINFELEHALSPLFIHLPEYGTRCSTVIMVDHDNTVTFTERSYNNHGKQSDEKTVQFQIEA